MNKETCLIPNDSEDEAHLLVADKYNFVTECFYFAHKAVDLGYQVTVDKLVRLNHVSFIGFTFIIRGSKFYSCNLPNKNMYTN